MVLGAVAAAAVLDALQYLVFPCNAPGWFTPASGFSFYLGGVLFVVLVARKRTRRLSLLPLAIAVLSALPWAVSHVCG